MEKSPYEILGVSKSATQDEIRNSYRKLARKFHPDLNPGKKDLELRFKELSSAYDLVSTPEKRADYDRGETLKREEQEQFRSRRNAGPFYHQSQPGGDDGRYSYSFDGANEDLFESLFGGAGRRQTSRPPPKGADQLYQMEVEFKDSVIGAEPEFSLPNGKRLKVKIPPGIESGAKLRFSGQGGPGAGSAPPGDAYVEIRVKPSPLYKKIGKDLEIELAISLSEAVLGGEIKVPTVDGPVMMQIPEGVSSGARLRLRGKGVGDAQTGKRGDQFVVLKVVLPQKVDPELKEAISSWSKTHSYNPREESRGAGT